MQVDTFIDEWLPRCSSEEVRVYLLTTRLESIGRPRKMTYAEFGVRAGVHPPLVHDALTSLAAKGVVDYQKRVLRVVMGETLIRVQLREDPTEIDDLVAENRDLRSQIADVGTSSGLAEKLYAEQGAVIRVSEGILGRALEIQEAYYLGDLINAYGPERVTKSIQACRGQKNPLRGAYARLKRGAAGVAASKKEPATPLVQYWEYSGEA